MIDWPNADIHDFDYQVDAEEIRTSGDRIVFPLRVSYRGDEFSYTLAVPVRSDFFEELRKLDGWKDALNKILRTRMVEDIHRRKRAARVDVRDKIDLMGGGA